MIAILDSSAMSVVDKLHGNTTKLEFSDKEILNLKYLDRAPSP